MKTFIALLLFVAIMIAGVVTVFQVNKAIKYYHWAGNFRTVFVPDIDNPANCVFDNVCTLEMVGENIIVTRKYKFMTAEYFLDPRWIKEGATIEQIQTYIAEYPYP